VSFASAAAENWLRGRVHELSLVDTLVPVPQKENAPPDQPRLDGHPSTLTLYICDLKTGVRTQLTFGEGVDYVVWSPDGRRVAYSTKKVGTVNTDLYVKRTDGLGNQSCCFLRVTSTTQQTGRGTA